MNGPLDPRAPGARVATSEGEDEVAALFRLAGAPPALPESAVAPVRDRAREVWRATLRRRAARHRWAWAGSAVAASALVAVSLVWLLRGEATRPPAVPVAGLELRDGGVTVEAAPGEPATAPGDAALLAGTVLGTAPEGRAALRLAGGASVRLAGGSRVRLGSARSLELLGGALYVDSGALPGETIEVSTPLGRVTDLGTQFEVQLSPSGAAGPAALRLRVREGEVRLEAGGVTHRAAAGSELVVTADGETRRAALAAHDPAWQWAARVAPAPEIEGRSLASLLDWAARELGLRWQVVEPRPARSPAETILHGSVAGLTPEEAIEVVLTSSGLSFEREGGELLISAAPGTP